MKRDEIIKTALKSQRYLFDSAMIRANEQLKMLFGYKLQELPPKESANEPEFESEPIHLSYKNILFIYKP